jgi:endoglucanase
MLLTKRNDAYIRQSIFANQKLTLMETKLFTSRLFFALGIILLMNAGVFAATPVETHGRLRVEGNQIVGEHGQPVQLMGMSLFWSVWGAQKYYNKDVVDWLVKDWNIDLIRTAVAVEVNGAAEGDKGWMYNREKQYAMVETVIRAAIDNGIYILIDWHTHRTHTEPAKEFFGYLARKYGHYPNLIWETFNEPVNQSWEEIAAFTNEVTAVIRPHSQNLIIAGTRRWSQLVNEPADNPLPDSNTAYSLHFYAGTHGKELREVADYALSKGIALFITEWGTSHADGGRDMVTHTEKSLEWIKWALERNISMANWSLTDKVEASAALKPDASVAGKWKPEKDLSPSGKFVREQIIQINSNKSYNVQ